MYIRRAKIRRWTILFYFSFDSYDKERILDALVWAKAPDSVISQVLENISAGRLNEGFCYSNSVLRRTVLGTGVAESGPEMLNSMVHEVIHICQHIALEDGMNPYDEPFAYLGGDIAREISDIVCLLSCPHCGGKKSRGSIASI